MKFENVYELKPVQAIAYEPILLKANQKRKIIFTSSDGRPICLSSDKNYYVNLGEKTELNPQLVPAGIELEFEAPVDTHVSFLT